MALEEFGNRLKAVRTDRGYTQKQLASALGVTEQAVSKWERDASYPDISMLDGISNVLDCSLDFLFQFEEGKENKLNQNSIECREEINRLLLPDVISLEFGYDFVSLFTKEINMGFPHINELRRLMAAQWGVVIPPIRLLDSSVLAAKQYRIRINGVAVFTETIENISEDVFVGMLKNLKEQIQNNIEMILNNQMVYIMVQNLAQKYPYVVDNIVPEQISYSILRKVIVYMIKEAGYTANPLVLIIQKLERYMEAGGMNSEEMAEQICRELPDGYALSQWTE